MSIREREKYGEREKDELQVLSVRIQYTGCLICMHACMLDHTGMLNNNRNI